MPQLALAEQQLVQLSVVLHRQMLVCLVLCLWDALILTVSALPHLQCCWVVHLACPQCESSRASSEPSDMVSCSLTSISHSSTPLSCRDKPLLVLYINRGVGSWDPAFPELKSRLMEAARLGSLCSPGPEACMEKESSLC